MSPLHKSLLIGLPGVLLMMGIDITAPNLILPHISATINISPSTLPWVITLYLLFYIGSIICGGRLGDEFGHRNVLLIGIGLFVLCSLFIASSTHTNTLLLGRALQGMSAGLIWPNSSALAFSSFDQPTRNIGIGIFTGFIGLSLALGPIIAGALITHFDWRSVFYINLPIGVFSMLVLTTRVKNIKNDKRNPIDITGALLIIVFMMALCFTLSQGGEHTPLHRYVSISSVVALIFGFAFFIQQKRSTSPLIAKALIRNRSLINGCMQRVGIAMPFYIILFLFGLSLQTQRHLSAIETGYIFLPMTLTIGLLSAFGGKAIDHIGLKIAALIANGLYLISFLALLFAMSYLTNLSLSLVLILPGLAFALGSPMSLAWTIYDVPKNLQGLASGVFYMSSLFSGLIGVTIASMLYQHQHSIGVVLAFCAAIATISGLHSIKAPKAATA